MPPGITAISVSASARGLLSRHRLPPDANRRSLLPGERSALAVLPDFGAIAEGGQAAPPHEWIGEDQQPTHEAQDWLNFLAMPESLLSFQCNSASADNNIEVFSTGAASAAVCRTGGENVRVCLPPVEEEIRRMFLLLASAGRNGLSLSARLVMPEAGVLLALFDWGFVNGGQMSASAAQLVNFLSQPLDQFAVRAPYSSLLETLTLPQSWNEDTVEKSLQRLNAAGITTSNPDGQFAINTYAQGLLRRAGQQPVIYLLSASRIDSLDDVEQEQVLCYQTDTSWLTLALHSSGAVLINTLAPHALPGLADQLLRQPEALKTTLPWAVPCPHCGAQTRPGKRHCPQCGALLLAISPV
jgi:hypothetical protein